MTPLLFECHETGYIWPHALRFYRCAMNGPNSPANGAPLDFCLACWRKLQWNIGPDAGAHKTQREAFYTRNFSPIIGWNR